MIRLALQMKAVIHGSMNRSVAARTDAVSVCCDSWYETALIRELSVSPGPWTQTEKFVLNLRWWLRVKRREQYSEGVVVRWRRDAVTERWKCANREQAKMVEENWAGWGRTRMRGRVKERRKEGEAKKGGSLINTPLSHACFNEQMVCVLEEVRAHARYSKTKLAWVRVCVCVCLLVCLSLQLSRSITATNLKSQDSASEARYPWSCAHRPAAVDITVQELSVSLSNPGRSWPTRDDIFRGFGEPIMDSSLIQGTYLCTNISHICLK